MRNSTLQPVTEDPDNLPSPPAMRDMEKPGSAYLIVGLANLRTQSWANAEKWFLKADAAGHPSAGFYLWSAILRQSAEGKDRRPEALDWLMKSAKTANPEAGHAMAKAYYEDKVTAQDFQKSFYWSCITAHRGYAPSMSLLADHYYFGTGVPADIDKAIYWAETALANAIDEAEPKLLRWKKLRQANRPVSSTLPINDKDCSP